MSWPYLPEDFERTQDSAWVWVPNALFDPQHGHRLLGEVTPDYLYWPSAAERMASYNPALKLIMVLRNPVTRAFSLELQS